MSLVCTGLVKAPLKRSRSTADGGDEDSGDLPQAQPLESGGPEEEERTDNTSLLRLLEEGEKVRAGGGETTAHHNTTRWLGHTIHYKPTADRKQAAHGL